MSVRIVRTARADRDIVEIGLFIAEDSIEAADRFLEAVETTFLALAEMPRMGALRTFRNPRFAGVRMWRVKDFEKYLIFYLNNDDGLEIVRVIHGAQDIPALFMEWQAERGEEKNAA